LLKFLGHKYSRIYILINIRQICDNLYVHVYACILKMYIVPVINLIWRLCRLTNWFRFLTFGWLWFLFIFITSFITYILIYSPDWKFKRHSNKCQKRLIGWKRIPALPIYMYLRSNLQHLQHLTKQKMMRYYCIYAMSKYSKLPEAPSAHEHTFSF